MNKTAYTAIVERLKEAAEKEAVLPKEGRVITTVVRVLTEPEPQDDEARYERLEGVVHDLTLLSGQLSMLVALGLADEVQQVAAQSSTTLMFALELASVAVSASHIDVSVLGEGGAPEGWFGSV